MKWLLFENEIKPTIIFTMRVYYRDFSCKLRWVNAEPDNTGQELLQIIAQSIGLKFTDIRITHPKFNMTDTLESMKIDELSTLQIAGKLLSCRQCHCHYYCKSTPV